MRLTSCIPIWSAPGTTGRYRPAPTSIVTATLAAGPAKNAGKAGYKLATTFTATSGNPTSVRNRRVAALAHADAPPTSTLATMKAGDVVKHDLVTASATAT